MTFNRLFLKGFVNAKAGPSVLQHIQVHIQSCVDVSCEQSFHCGKVMLTMILIKCIVVGNPISKLNINKRKSCFHQLKIYKQPSGSAITVWKWNDEDQSFHPYQLNTIRNQILFQSIKFNVSL